MHAYWCRAVRSERENEEENEVVDGDEQDQEESESENEHEVDSKSLESQAELKQLAKCWEIPSVCVMVRGFQDYLKMSPITPKEFEYGLLDPMSDIRMLCRFI